MSVLVVAVPLFDGNMTVKAYRLRDHNTQYAFDTKGDFRGRELEYQLQGLDMVQQVGIAPVAAQLPLFVDVMGFHIMTGLPSHIHIRPDKLVLTLPADIAVDDKLLEGIKTCKASGYGIAVDGYPKGGYENALFECADTIILDYEHDGFREHLAGVRRYPEEKRLVISNLPSREAYHRFSLQPGALFGGEFYRDPITEGEGDISPLKVNALQLLREINEDDFELQDITKIIERDPSLSISLLRFINSAAVGLVNKVQSINSAVAILGQKEIRRWARVAISVSLSQDHPSEIIKVSLVRARFAENLASVFSMGVFQDSLFLLGLFSMLDIMLDLPMEEAVNELALNELIRDALVGHRGSLYSVIEFICAYERADWNSVSLAIIQNNLNGALIGKAFTDALVWYSELLDSIGEATKDGEDQSI